MGAVEEMWMDCYEAALEDLVEAGMSEEDAIDWLDEHPDFVDGELVDYIAFIADQEKG